MALLDPLEAAIPPLGVGSAVECRFLWAFRLSSGRVRDALQTLWASISSLWLGAHTNTLAHARNVAGGPGGGGEAGSSIARSVVHDTSQIKAEE